MDKEYCIHCKGLIQEYDKYKITEKGLIHNNDEKDCFSLTENYIDDFGDVVTNEE